MQQGHEWKRKAKKKVFKSQNFNSNQTYIVNLHWIYTIVVFLFILGKNCIRKIQ